MTLFFYLFAILLIISALMVVASHNSVYSVLWLIFAFCNGSGLMILLGAEFIAMMLIIIYVGAVAVLFLFVIMMLNVNLSQRKTYTFKHVLLYGFISLVFFIDLVTIILLGTKKIKLQEENILTISANISNVNHIGSVLYTEFILVFQSCGIILFSAMIACISLTMRNNIYKKGNLRQQNTSQQLARNKENSLKIAGLTGIKGLGNLNYDD